jgi:hypothetical protein
MLPREHLVSLEELVLLGIDSLDDDQMELHCGSEIVSRQRPQFDDIACLT